eukprot:scaffold38518_cov54-Phaeocystis_antarctica.AAC.3
MKDKVAWAKKLNKNMMFDGFSFVSLEIGTREETSPNPTRNPNPNPNPNPHPHPHPHPHPNPHPNPNPNQASARRAPPTTRPSSLPTSSRCGPQREP